MFDSYHLFLICFCKGTIYFIANQISHFLIYILYKNILHRLKIGFHYVFAAWFFKK